MSNRIVYQKSSGQISFTGRQRNYAWLLICRSALKKITRLLTRRPRWRRPRRRRVKRYQVKYKFSYLRRLEQEGKPLPKQPRRGRRQVNPYRRIRRPRFWFVFKKFQPNPQWLLVLRELRRYLRRYRRKFVFRIRLHFTSSLPAHNGVRLKKPRRK